MNLIKSVVTVLLLCGSTAFAESIKVDGGYIFQPLKGTNATAGYGVIKNLTDKEVTLKVVSAEGFKAVELHETSSVDGRMQMQKVDQFKIEKNGSFELKPGGFHVMLFDATRKFKENDTVSMSFKLDEKDVSIPFKIKLRNKAAEHTH